MCVGPKASSKLRNGCPQPKVRGRGCLKTTSPVCARLNGGIGNRLKVSGFGILMSGILLRSARGSLTQIRTVIEIIVDFVGIVI